MMVVKHITKFVKFTKGQIKALRRLNIKKEEKEDAIGKS